MFSILICSLLGLSAFAGPADPSPLEYSQPDGSIVRYFLHGDEYLNWMTDESGDVIVIGEDGYVRRGEIPSEAAAQRAAQKRSAAVRPRLGESKGLTGTHHFLVLLVQYPDLAMIKTKSEIEDFFNGTGAGSTGSVQQYYNEQSDGQFTPVFDVHGPVTLSSNRAFYKDAPLNAVIGALQVLDSEIDLTSYRSPRTGLVESVIMVFAGHSQASGDPDGIWPHRAGMSWYSDQDGIQVNSYCCGPELQGASGSSMAGIGHICHELGHCFGIPDFYDTNRDDGLPSASNCFDFSLMAGGSYNNYSKTPPPLSMMEKYLCGWAALGDIPTVSSSGNLTLHEIGQDRALTRAYRIDTDMTNEFFVCEYRSTDPSVNKWGSALARGGMLVYHVDRSTRSLTIDGYTAQAGTFWNGMRNVLNNNYQHPLYYLIPSGDQGNLTLSDTDANMRMVPFPGSSNVISYTPVSWNGVVANVSLGGLSYTAANTSMTIKAYAREFPLINNPGKGVYAQGETFYLILSPGTSGSDSVSAWKFDGESASGSVVLTSGKHAVEAVLVSGKKLRLELTAK